MAFRIKNITEFTVSILGITLKRKAYVDLQQTLTNTVIRDSLLSGELYHKIQGRMLSVLSPPQDWGSIGLTTAQISRLTHAGFFQGFLGLEELKPPFSFDADGYLYVSGLSSGGGGGAVTGEVSVRGIVADGGAADNFPIEIGGVDEFNIIRSISVNSDGYLNVAGTASATYGPVADNNPAYGFPVEIGAVDSLNNIHSLLVDDDGYLMTSSVISVETSSEIEGRVFDGEDGTAIKPVIISGIDEDGYSQSMLVSSDGELHIRAYDAPADAIRTFETAPVNTTFLLEELIDDTNLAVDTYYYIITMDNYKDLSLEFELSTNATMTVEVSNDNTFATPKDITVSGNELVTGTNGYVSFVNMDGVLDFDNINIGYVRVVLDITNATNTVKILARKKAL